MNKTKFILAGLIIALGACAAPPASEMERQARMAAGAEFAARNCSGAVGGFSATRDLRAEANQRVVAARELGASDDDMQKARRDVASTFGAAEFFGSRREACNQLVSEMAWAMG